MNLCIILEPALIAKSSIILDCKPWDDETDMGEMEKHVRAIECDGLLWGASKLVPLAYGIMKLHISCVIEDEKVSVDWLQEEIEKIEDLVRIQILYYVKLYSLWTFCKKICLFLQVQSCDVAAFNKI